MPETGIEVEDACEGGAGAWLVYDRALPERVVNLSRGGRA
jgi:hypothetical protein